MSTRLNSTHVDNLELTTNAAAPFTPGADERFIAAVNNTLVFWDGTSWTTVGSVPGGSVPTWETLFAGDSTFTVTPDSTFTIAGNRATATDVVTLTNIGGSSGDVLQITNSGTGYDVSGTSATWFVTKAGAATFVGVTPGGDITSTATAIDWDLADNNASALSIDAGGIGSMLNFDTRNGAEVLSTAALTFSVVDGQGLFASTSNTAANLHVTNDTITTFGTGTTEDQGMIVFSSDTLTTGDLVRLQLDESALNGGAFLKAVQTDAGAAVFTVGENGNTTIAGVGGSNMLTVTAGDVVLGDGSITVTDADNAATFTVTNNTATTIGAAASGGVASLVSTSLTTGALLNLQLTEGTLNGGWYIRAWDATGSAGVFSVGEDGLTTIAGAGGSNALVVTAGDVVFSDASLSLTDADNAESVTIINNTATTIGAAASAGIVQVESTSLTTGAAVNVQLTEGTLNGGFYYSAWDATGGARVWSVGEDGATVIAGAAIGTAALTVTAGDVLLNSGSLTVSGKLITSGTETIAAGGTTTALSLTKTVHYIDADAGGDTFTLADGIAGQIMYVLLTSSTGVATITPANLAGFTSVTLNADGDSVILMFMDTEWFILGGNSYGTA